MKHKNRILIVDDMAMNLDFLSEILEEEYDIDTATNGLEAVEAIEKDSDRYCALLLDLVMPKMDGYEVLKYMNEKDIIHKLPVLIITGEQSVQSERACFDLGVSDFIRKPFDSVLVKRRVSNVVELSLYRKSLEKKVEEQTEKLRKNNENVIDILGSVVESRSTESGQHIARVKGYTEILARKMMVNYTEYGLTEKKIKLIVAASALHDLGKVAIPDNILLKPGRFTPEEFEIMKTHTIRGCELLDNIKHNWDKEYTKASYEICRYHHERYDGKGYPEHLVGDDIPISAQLVSIADVYDALISKRCYKDAYALDEAFNMILNGECGTFSPKLIDCFKNSKEQFEALALKESGE